MVNDKATYDFTLNTILPTAYRKTYIIISSINLLVISFERKVFRYICCRDTVLGGYLAG